MPTQLDELPPGSLAARDHARQQTASDVDELLRRAVAVSGRPERRLRKEMRQARKGLGRITAIEYLQYRLFDRDEGEQREFISDWLHWPIHEVCQDPVLSPITVDKWRCTEALSEADIPAVEIVGVVDPAGDDYGATPTVTTSSRLVDLIRSAEGPLFAKPNDLLGSFGAFRIDGVDPDGAVTINGNERVDPDRAIGELMAGIPYVIQPLVENHGAIAPLVSGLATVRTVNLVSPDEVRIAASVLKLPIGGNVADNFWRPGNLVADVDPRTGTIRRVVQGTGPAQLRCDHHPETGRPLVGLTLPGWDEVIELNERVAERFSPIRYQSQDVALTPDGPVVVEVNSGSSFSLPQIASGRGFLVDEHAAFFESCGVDFRRLPEPRSR